MRKNLFFILLALTVSSLTIPTHAQKKEITLEDIWQKNTFGAKGVQNFRVLKDGKRFIKQENGGLVLYDVASGKFIDSLVTAKNLVVNGEKYPVFNYSLSNDENSILIESKPNFIYRHSYEARVLIYNIKTKKVSGVLGSNLRYATLSPDGKFIAFVDNNNLLIKAVDTDEIQTVTGDGSSGHIINGAVDWVYEEEFAMSKGFEWSPNSKHIAFYKFNELEVPQFSLEYYTGKTYPKIETYKYPKAGEKNSLVSLHIYSLETAETNDIANTSDDSYIPRIQWNTQNGELCYQKLNRHQNHLEVFFAEANTGKSKKIYEEKNKYYIDINDKYYFSNDGINMIYLSEKNGFNQIYSLDLRTGSSALLNKGKFDIDHIHYFDTEKNVIYYTSAEVSPSERYLYRHDLKKNTIINLSKGKGWHSITFSENGQYYLNNYSTFTSPARYSLHNSEGKEIRVLEENKELEKLLKEYKLGETSFGTFTTSLGHSLNYWQILPPDFSENKKYPVLFFVYGGPGSQTVKNAWGGGNYMWHQYLAQKGYIVVSVDNRGTGFRGEEFKKTTYLNLGKYEIEDQIEAAKWMGDKKFVDKNRIGIWGWSYGGFMSSLGITAGSEYFKTAIAVAPVTHWKYYDNIYTERYMRTPAENADGYNLNSPITLADRIKGNYLLIHGMADDNVHLQHANEMIRTMVDKNIAFDSEYYPNKNHGIGGGNTRIHLYSKMTKFILEKL